MNKKILIVEDEAMLLKVLAEQFSKSGFDVESAEDGEKALKVLGKYRPDIILLDIILPKINGFDVLRAVKENPDIRDIPVIMISNLGRDEDIKQAIKLGAVDYFIKAQHPIFEIIEKVSKFLSTPKSPLEKSKIKEEEEVIAKSPERMGKLLKKLADIAEESAEEAVKRREEKVREAEITKEQEQKEPEKTEEEPKDAEPSAPHLSKGARKFIRMKKAELHKMGVAPEKYEEEISKTYEEFIPKEKTN